MSLTACLKKAGDALRAEDKAEILAAAAKYRKAGMGADEAGRKAVDDQIAKVQAMLEAPAAPAAEVAAPAPEPAPAAPAADQPEAETDAIDQRIAEAELAGVELSDDDKDKIRAALTKAEELNRKAGRISGLASDPMRKGNAFPMGVGFTRMSKRAEQRIDASVKRAGEAVEVFKRAEQAERYAEALLAGNGTDADKIRKEEIRTETRRLLLDKLLNWKKGDKIGAYTIERVSNDAEGYPSSYTISGDGIIKGVTDKVQVAREFFDGDKEALRAMVDEIRGPAAAPEAAPPAAPAPAAPASKTPTVDAHLALFKAVRAGTATPDEFKAMYRRFRDDKAAVVAELNTSTKDQLLQDISGYVRPGTTKSELVELIYTGLLRRFALGKDYGPSSYFMGQEKAYEQAKRDALDALVEGQTAESLAEYAAAAKAEFDAEVAKRTALMESVKDPKTLQDFRNYMRLKTSEGMDYQEARMTLTPEQRAAMDELAATETRSRRTSAKEEQRTQVRVAGQMVDGGIIATKHTKKGHDLYVVRLSERVSTEDYRTLLEGAKRIGGYYSSYRGGGAIPGFQFTERAQAEAFVKLAGGDNTAAQEAAKERRNAYDDDRSQSAAERLVEMAEKMEEDADESLGRDRKANTERRARFAAAAEAGARNLQAMAKTMRNVAQALTAGKAKFLDRIRTRTQIELLQTYVANAKGDQLRAKYPSYAEQEKRRGEPPDLETADYAEFPSYTAYRSDLASLGRQLLELDGTKKLGERLMKVADDVSDAFTAWVKEPGNFYRVGVYSTKEGGRAGFTTKDAAERAIARSGFRGKAIPWSIKRGEWTVIMSPSEAIAKGIWQGDGDKRITLSDEFGSELVEGIGRVAKRQSRDRLNAKAAAVPWQFERAYERRKQLQRMGLETPAEFRSALREFIGLREQAAEADRVKMLERAMVGKAKDGLDFFPTPESVADEMIAAADIKPDMAVLEPSAGMGHIADRIRAAGAEPEVVEMAEDRRELLQEKGYYLQPYRDFLQMEPRNFFTFGDVMRAPDGREGIMHGGPGWSGRASLHEINPDGTEGKMIGWYDRNELVGVRHRGFRGNDAGGYDRIIMNPPFSNGRDIDHVRHAYTLLKPGGRVVAIMGESAFTNQNKKATEFREWLDSVGGTEEKLPAGTFLDPSLPVNTGANARMVVIERPESDTAFSRASTRIEPEAADAVGREFWRKIEAGEVFSDKEVQDALSINRRGSRRDADAAAFAQSGAATGQSVVHWSGEIAGFDGYRTAAAWDGDSFTVVVVPDELAGDADLTEPAQARDRAIVSYALRLMPDGRHELSISDPAQGGQAEQVLRERGLLEPAGTEAKPYSRINIGRTLSSALVQESVRRLALNIGKTPTVFYPQRDTGARAGQTDSGRAFDEAMIRERLSRASTGRGITMTDARAVAGNIRAALPKAPPIILHESVDKAPRKLRDAIAAEGAERDVEAAYHEGEIHVFPAHIESIERMEFVVGRHEVRHYGIRAMLGPRYGQTLLAMVQKNPALREAARKKIDDGLARSMVEAADEALADMPVEQIAKLNGFDRFVAAIRQWLRDMAAKLRRGGMPRLADAIDPKEWTDRDVAAFVLKAEDMSRKGSPEPQSTGGTMFGRDADEPAFYSALTRVIDGAQAKAMSAEGWRAFLKGQVQKGAVKQDEITWSGVEEWLGLQPGKVSRDDLADFVRDNGVRVKETVLSDNGSTDLPPGWQVRLATEDDDVESRWVLVDDEGEVRGEGNTSAQAMEDGWDPDSAADVPTKYSQYTLPGGTNYREVLLTLPKRQAPQPELVARADGLYNVKLPDGRVLDSGYTAERAQDLARDFMRAPSAQGGADTANYKSSHWDQPNILAHIRLNDRRGFDEPRRRIEARDDVFPAKVRAQLPLDVVQGGVLAAAHDDHVRKAVVAALPVDVVNALRAEQAAPEDLFGNDAVRLALLASPNGSFKVLPGLVAALRQTEASVGAKVRSALVAGLDEQVLPALRASDFEPSVVRRLLASVGVDESSKAGARGAQLGGARSAAAFSEASRTGAESGGADGALLTRHAEILAHRDRTDADGKRVLFVEELQSDWGQAAKRYGVNDPRSAPALAWGDDNRAQVEGGSYNVIPAGGGGFVAIFKAEGPRGGQREAGRGATEAQAKRAAEIDAAKTSIPPGSVPAAPFIDKTDKWVSLALKRVIKMAVDGGYDRVAFVTGEQSAERYDLSKQVRSIAWTGRANDTEKRVTITPNAGNDIEFMVQPDGAVGSMGGGSIGNEFDGKRLDEIVGKEVAERILGEPYGDMRGNGLKVGGAGMVAFYDKIVPAALKDVLRKVGGGAMEAVALEDSAPVATLSRTTGRYFVTQDGPTFATREEANAWARERVAKQPGFTITPAMREKAAGGLPMFSRAQGWTIQSAAKAFRRMVDQAEDDLAGVLFNWNESELKGDLIVRYPGRDSYKTMGEAEGGKITTPKREFMAWLMSDGPFDTKVYGPEIAQNEEWVGQINRLRALAAEQTTTRFSRAPGLNMSREAITKAARNTVHDLFADAGAKVSWWDKSIGTQYAKARKFPGYGIVFDKVQEYLEDVSTLANEAADSAPDILPKLEKWSDFKKMGISGKDAQAIAAPIFQGTLDKVRYDEDTLRGQFGLNDQQVAAYRQFFATVNTSLDQIMAAEVIRLLGDKSGVLRSLALDDRAALRQGVDQYLTEQIEANPADAELVALHNSIMEKYGRIDQLKAEGYAPLMRFGKYKVHIVEPSTGQTKFFGLYESAGEANRAARELMEDPEMKGYRVEQGVLSEKQYTMFAAVPMDSLEMFAEALGADQSDVFKEYIRLAKNNRSALKRLLNRKGTAGYSTDARRVLAAFVTSNARLAAGALNLPGAKEAALNIREGDVQDEAIGLIDTIQNPRETAGWARGLMFVNFIGGSIASALVNVTQPLTMTLPWLSQFGGIGKASKRLMAAGGMASTGKGIPKDVAAALKRAEADGIVSPQEIHYLQAQAMGKMGGNPVLQRVAYIWAAPFTMAEQFNRRTTFIAAYLTAKEHGIGEAAFDFAQRAVTETQGLYNKGNQANWARNPVGAAVLTFKQFSVHYLEWMRRMWTAGTPGSAERRAGRMAVAYALAILIVAAGTDGLPFADDLDDLIDTLAQAMGYDLNTKKARREFVANTLGLGDVGADVVARGFSAMAGIPFDVSLRMSMGNLVPGTGMLLRSNVDRSREVLELAGPAGGLVQQYVEAGEKALAGDAAGAVERALPVALQNVSKAVGMWSTGEARDTRGRRIMETDEIDGLMRFLGFNPQAIARESEKLGMLRRSEQLAKNVEGEIASDWARALADKDADGVRDAKQRLADWNAKNPDQPIRITGGQILKRVQKLRQDRRERFITSTSPERRLSISEALQ